MASCLAWVILKITRRSSQTTHWNIWSWSTTIQIQIIQIHWYVFAPLASQHLPTKNSKGLSSSTLWIAFSGLLLLMVLWRVLHLQGAKMAEMHGRNRGILESFWFHWMFMRDWGKEWENTTFVAHIKYHQIKGIHIIRIFHLFYNSMCTTYKSLESEDSFRYFRSFRVASKFVFVHKFSSRFCSIPFLYIPEN